MARKNQQTALQRFQESLENLTFNSKPLIDDLTRAADASKSQAPKIVEMIESRIMQVARVSGVKIISIIVYRFCVIFYAVVSIYQLCCLLHFTVFGVSCDLKGVTNELATPCPGPVPVREMHLFFFY